MWTAAAFLGARAVHEIRLPRGQGSDADRDPWRAETRRQILIYTVLLVPVALGLGFTSVAGPVYLAAALVAERDSSSRAPGTFWRRDEDVAQADGYATEKRGLPLFGLLPHFSCISARPSRRCGPAAAGGLPDGRSPKPMTSTSGGWGATSAWRVSLVGFAAIVFGLTVAKIREGASMEAFDHQPRVSITPIVEDSQ